MSGHNRSVHPKLLYEEIICSDVDRHSRNGTDQSMTKEIFGGNKDAPGNTVECIEPDPYKKG